MSSIRDAAATILGAALALVFAWWLPSGPSQTDDVISVEGAAAISDFSPAGSPGSSTTATDGDWLRDYPTVDEERLVDRYGNRVEPAVGDYRIDHRGDMYESHSPQTALPELIDAGT